MYCIVVYDVGEKRVAKMLKLCRRYMSWIQNSVFEGELSELQLKKFTNEVKIIIDAEYDSIILFSGRESAWLNKQIIGLEKGPTDVFL